MSPTGRLFPTWSVPKLKHSPRSKLKHQTAVFTEIAEGLRAVTSSRLLSTLAIWEAVRSFFGTFIGALYVLFGLRELGLSPLLVGLSVRVAGRQQFSGVLYWSTCDGTAGRRRADNGRGDGRRQHHAVPDCPGSGGPGGRIHCAGHSTIAGPRLIHPLYSVNALTLRQVTTPPHLLGRVNATLHVVERGVIPFGALAGGMLGDAIGLRPTLLVAAAGIALGTIWAARSRLLRQR